MGPCMTKQEEEEIPKWVLYPHGYGINDEILKPQLDNPMEQLDYSVIEPIFIYRWNETNLHGCYE